ncbi:MAG: DNA/RNA non-specific endonuclease [Coriobacteriales bacterium]|nr:DNA/RNA non-specific endonuclease [Coriobacteriales bacterium]
MRTRCKASPQPSQPHARPRKLAAVLVAAVALVTAAVILVPSVVPFSAMTQHNTERRDEQDAPPPSEWDYDVAPDYYRVIGPASDVFVLDTPGTTYGELDKLGRATYAEGLVDVTMMREGIDRPRGDLSSIYPSGWGNNGQVDINLSPKGWYHGYFWNRSHLLAKSLGGDDQTHNLVCGTRTQNVGANDGGGGMAYCESTCRQWLEDHPAGTISYRATASYVGRELVPRSVFVDMRSSDGSVDQHVEVFNAARGYAIDYEDGTFWAQQTASVPSPTQGEQGDDLSRPVVISGSGKAYHSGYACSGLRDADQSQLRTVTLEEARAMGKHACGICGG